MKQENFYPDMAVAQDKTCIPWEQTIRDVKIAHAYVPIQKLCTTYNPLRSLIEGTAFPEFTGYYWNPTASR